MLACRVGLEHLHEQRVLPIPYVPTTSWVGFACYHGHTLSCWKKARLEMLPVASPLKNWTVFANGIEIINGRFFTQPLHRQSPPHLSPAVESFSYHVPSVITRGVMKRATWEVIMDLTRVVWPMVVIFWPSQVTNFPATLSSRHWRSTFLSCHTERGRPKYLIGNDFLDVRKF